MKQFPLSIVLLNPNKYFLGFLADFFARAQYPRQNFADITEQKLRVNSLAIAVPKGCTGDDIDKFLAKHWAQIIETQLSYLDEHKEFYPNDLSFTATKHWFDHEFHPMLYWLAADGDTLDQNQNIMATVVAPNQHFIEWVHENRVKLCINIPDNSILSADKILKRANVYLTASIQDPTRLQKAFHVFAQQVLINEFSLWAANPEIWPQALDVERLDKFFSIEPHYDILSFG